MDDVWHDKDGLVKAHRSYCDGCGQAIKGLYYRVQGNHLHRTCSKACAMKIISRELDIPIDERPEIYVDTRYYTPYGKLPDDVDWDWM